MSRSVGLGAALALLLVLLVSSDARSIAGILEQATRFQASGGATTVILSPGGVDGRACDRLSNVTGIQSAGAARRAPDSVFDVLPSTGVPTYTVSPDFSRVLGVSAGSEGVLVSKELADDLSVAAGDIVRIGSEPTHISAVFDYPADGRRADLEYSVLLPTPTTSPFDQCWVTAWPTRVDAGLILRTSLVADAMADAQPEIRQLNSTLGADFDGTGMYDERPYVLAPIIAPVAAFLLSLAGIIRRRVEFASALHTGITKVALAAQVAVESAITAIAPLLVGISAALIATNDISLADQALVRLEIASIPLSGACGFILGGMVASLFISESSLFRYFKNR